MISPASTIHSTLHTPHSTLSSPTDIALKPLSLYIHIPFCASKCAYCDFASFPGREGDWRRYFEVLSREIEGWRGQLPDREVATVFVGGGTPTLVDAGYIAGVLEACRVLLPFGEDVEITMEGNPGTLTPQKLVAYRAAGVNRLSLGAQSFDDGLLKALGRIHSVAQIGEAVAMAREAGFENINLDLMYALPGQGMAQWEDTLDAAVALGVEHLSAYSLIVEPGTPMAARVASGAAALPEDEAVNAMQRQAVAWLARAGYARYEISNYAKPGRECRHNLVYWNRGEYLGLGCAAHSLVDGCRFHNPEALDAYLAGPRREEVQRLTPQDCAEELLMLSTRTTRGMELGAWRTVLGRPFEAGREEALARLERGGFIEMADGFMKLTPRGMELHNAVVLELVEETR